MDEKGLSCMCGSRTGVSGLDLTSTRELYRLEFVKWLVLRFLKNSVIYHTSSFCDISVETSLDTLLELQSENPL